MLVGASTNGHFPPINPIHSLSDMLADVLRGARRLLGGGPGHRVLLLNDTRDQNNWGSIALSDALERILRDAIPGLRLESIPSIQLWESIGPSGEVRMRLPEGADDFDRVARAWEAGEGGVEAEDFIRRARRSDLVIYNGEGSIYRRNHSAIKALFMTWYARQRLGIPALYLNGGLHLTHVEPFVPPIAAISLGALDGVAIREPWSMRCLEEFCPGVRGRLIPDSVFYFAIRPEGMPGYGPVTGGDRDPGGEPYFCLAGGQMPYLIGSGPDAPVCRMIRELRGLVPRCLILAREDEDQYLRRVAEWTGSEFLGPERSYGEVVRLIANARFQITGRYHHFIFGTLVGCPAIPFAAMSHKLQGVNALFGERFGKVRNATSVGLDIPEIVSLARGFLEKGEPFREEIREVARALGESTREFGSMALEALARTGRGDTP